jgi:hypothetical protein
MLARKIPLTGLDFNNIMPPPHPAFSSEFERFRALSKRFGDDMQNDMERLIENQPITISVDQALKMTGIGQTHLYALMADGFIASRKCGKRRLVLFQSLCDYINNLPTGKLTPQS